MDFVTSSTYWHISPLRQILCHSRNSLSRTRCSEINLETITGGKHSSFGDGTGGTDVPRCVVPLCFGDGELFADFDGCVMDGKYDYVYLEFFGC